MLNRNWRYAMSDRPEAGGGALIDVVLPVCNYGRFLATSMPSLTAQSVTKIRIIAVDYGSSDETPAILKSFAQSDSRIDVITMPSGTLVDALKVGCGAANAPFIARQDADDISYPDRFERQLEVFERDKDVVAVSGSCRHIDSSGHDAGKGFGAPNPEEFDYRAIPSREPLLLQPFVMLRRDAYLEVGGYRDAFDSFSEDTDLFWRLRRIGRLFNLSDELGAMRIHSASISNASVLNGRLMAVFSQLAAISAQRAESGRPDITLMPGMAAEMRESRSFEIMLSIASRDLDDRERAYLTNAASAKLLQLAAVRAFEIELEDCHFVRGVYTRLGRDVLKGHSVANWAYRQTLARFLRKGMVQHLGALGGSRAVLRVALMRLLPALPLASTYP